VYHVIGVLVSAQQEGAKSAVTQVNADVGVQWLFSFLSADKKKTYCLYEAPNAEAILVFGRLLRRGVYPELVEGLLAMTSALHFSNSA